MKTFKPMLATPIDFSKINPDSQYMVSPKLDGVRCLVNKSGVFTRSMKPLPNKYITEKLLDWVEDTSGDYWFDGEIVVGYATDPMCYRKTTSVVMTAGWHRLDWKFYIFDAVSDRIENDAYSRLLEIDDELDNTGSHDSIEFLEQILKRGRDVEALCEEYIKLGYEGAMVKPADAPYKYGRATPKSMELMKYKAWEDDEATIIGYVQKEKNTNEAKVNELGNTERSSHKSGMVAVDELGSLVVDYKGKQFNIGSGFTEEERKKLWLTRDKLIGRMVKFKYMPYGEYEVPRMPIYLGFRDKRDL